MFHSIKTRLLAFILCVSLASIAEVTVVDYLNFRHTLKKQATEWMSEIITARKGHIQSILNMIKAKTADFSNDGYIRRYIELINVAEFLRHEHIVALNHYLLGKIADPDIAAIAVVNIDGIIVASSSEKMIGVDFSDQDVFIQTTKYGYLNTPCYSPHLGEKILYCTVPLVTELGEKMGVLLSVWRLNVLNKITTQRTGMRESGEVYIVNKDKKMITDSRFIENAPLEVMVDTEPVRLVVERGETMVDVYPDYRNIEVVGASACIPEYGWTLLSEIDKTEAFAPLKWVGIFAGIVGSISAAVVSAVGIVFATSVSMPIRRLTDTTQRFTMGYFETRCETIRRNDEIGSLIKSFNTMADELEKEIIDRGRREVELRKLFLAVEQCPNVVFITDIHGNIEYVNHKFTTLTGYTKEEVIGKNPRILKSGKTPPEVYKQLWETITSGSEWRGEFCNAKKNGELYWESAFISSIKNAAGDVTHFIAIAEDATERIQAAERIRQMAYYDLLTGLPNRVLYNDRLLLALVHAQRTREMVAVLFLDLDRFKDINDTLGHSMGDQMLKVIAGRLSDSLRKEDTVTRQGGDEFTLLLPGVERVESVVGIAKKILGTIKKPLMLGSHEVNITASIGIAIYPADGEDAETLLKNADTAMYYAKEQGRNNYQFFTSTISTKSIEQLEMESNLHHALERKELIVYYQPQVDVKTGRIVSSEALLRWQYPKLGLVKPSEFIGIAERTGLIVPIGEWTLRTACAQNRALQDAGLPPMPVAVNLSVRQFQQENLEEMVNLVLKETGMDPRFLVLEVTESTAMKNIEAANYKMKILISLGVHFAIDDLGTGYSSLSQLKTLPIHALKIDNSFVKGVMTDSNDAAIVTAIISMSKGLGLKVVAEGVETTAQLEFLRSLGCDEAEGYLFGKPMTAGEFKKMLEQDKHLQV